MYKQFAEVLKELGGKATNKVMLEKLGWTKEEYEMIKTALKVDGLIASGRGRGGTVKLVEKTPVEQYIDVVQPVNSNVGDDNAN